MSISVTNSFVQQYARDAHNSFQRQGTFLMTTVRHQPDVTGSTTTFQKVGTGIATTKARHGTITPMNQTHTAVQCTLNDFYAGDWVDMLDEKAMNMDERQVVTNGGAWALGRKVDEQILTAMDGTTEFVGTHSGAITRTLLLQAAESLDSNDVPNDGNRWGLLTPRQWASAMTISEFASGDYVGDKPFVKGSNPRTWMGINWMVHTGAPGKGTATAKGLVYHRSAVGYASAKPISSDVTWHGDRAALFINHMMKGGACLIDAQGVVEVRTDDTAAIPA